ncbi:MAG: hypothetical protein IT548_09990 [Alphaproteobacteria bacterium]|nr:hypothetical protein [Alphaproteobacteria bacterium]
MFSRATERLLNRGVAGWICRGGERMISIKNIAWLALAAAFVAVVALARGSMI